MFGYGEQSMSPSLSYTCQSCSSHPLLPSNSAHHHCAGRWPDDPLAFKKTKAALGLQLGMSLEAAFGHSISATEDYVDVLTEGFAFRLLFHSSRDEAMLAKEESGLTSAMAKW